MRKSRDNHIRRFEMRFTAAEFSLLQGLRRRTGLSMSCFIRRVLLDKSPQILDREIIRNYRSVLKLAQVISNNINQIARVHNALLKSKVNFTEQSRRTIADTLAIMQIWERNKKGLLQPPLTGDDS